MGSGSSSQASKSLKDSSNGRNITKAQPKDPVIGSSSPPKGPPPGMTANRNGTANNKNNTKHGPVKGTVDRRDGSKPGNDDARTQSSMSQISARDRPQTRSNTKIKPPMSARVRRGTEVIGGNARKSIVRQMERGVEDENDVDNVLGLQRIKTKMQLKREKTRKMMNTKFQNAANKTIQRRDSHYHGPQTKLDDIYVGNVTIECPSTTKIVRIFTSSTFTDTMHERNKLMEDAYPKVKVFCQQLGYDFQVVDMRWGVRDQATDDNMGTEMCLNELKMCQKLSTGPNFVSLMSHKYGYTDFPRCIEAEEFETIMKHIQNENTLGLFKKWYAKDMNAVPPAYVVAPISSKIPDFISSEKEKKDTAKKQWWEESEAMQAELERVATEVFDAEKARRYTRSVTETEVANGMLDVEDLDKCCIWLHRAIEDIQDQDDSYLLSRYIECNFNNSKEKVQKSREMLKQLKDNKMKQKLSNDNILHYSLKWDKSKGLNPDKDKAHREYLERLNKDFVAIMCRKIKTAVDEKKQADDPLVNEIVQHIEFCQDKLQQFHGRGDVIQKIKDYACSMSNEPLILHGMSGSGKTSIMAMVAKEAWKWTNSKATIILRFIGTTPKSSTVHGLLASVTSQIRKAYGMSWTVSEDQRTLIDEFQLCLFLATSERPILLIFDSLDMLDPSHNSRQLQWLPSKLRPNVKIIVSTLPDSQYESFPALQTMVRTQQNFIEITKLPDSDVSGIIDKWLNLKRRKLADSQKKLLLTTFTKCPIPLFLKLSFDKASTWTSFAPKNTTVLESTVRSSIDALFKKLESIHGYLFVSRALGYLTTAKAGLTETELEDIMSCDDDVLNDVYMYWTPPIRRLPPLLLVRLRADLSQYIVDRGADNVRVVYWHHRQFIEAARNRYCGDDVSDTLHANLADFFSGVWADGKKKPYTSKKGEKGSEDRHVSSQPNKFGNAYNLRKFNNLPYHRTSSKQLDLLKSECLGNFEFLLEKLRATSLWQIMDDFALAKSTYPDDELINNISDVLHLSHHGLLYDSNQLLPQIIGRLPKTKTSEEFLENCKTYPVPSILPDKSILTQPGGQLIHSMAGHKGDILSLDLTMDSATALTCSDDGSIRLWSVSAGKQIRSFDGLGKMSRALFCFNDKYILIEMNKKVTVRAAMTGEIVFDIKSVNDDYPLCVVGEGKTSVVVFKEQNAIVYDLTDGVCVFSIQCGGNFEFKFPGFAVGSKNYAVVTTSDQVFLTIMDMKKRQFSSMFKGFEPFNEEELGETIQYEIDEMAITVDEKSVLYSNIYTNDIVFLDIKSLKKTKVVKGNPNDYVRSLRCSLDGKSMYLVKGAFVNFYNMNWSAVSEELEHTVEVISVCTNDMKTVVTTAEDSNVRVWDRTKQVQKISKNPGVTATKIRMMVQPDNSRYLIGFGFKTREGTSQFLFVYDVLKNCTINERSLDCSILQFEMLNDKELLVLPDVIHKLQVVNIETLTVCKQFQGYLPNTNWSFKTIQSRKECATLTCGRHYVKIYNTDTGKVSAILRNSNQQKLEGLSVNDVGTVLVTWCEDPDTILVFDLIKRKLLHTLKPKHVFLEQGSDSEPALIPNGNMVLFKVEDIPAQSMKGTAGVDEVYVEVWNTKSGSKVTDLLDIEYYNRYMTQKVKIGCSSSVDTFKILDNTKALLAHEDFIIRIFDMQTGSILCRLTGHTSSIEIIYNPKCPYILTYGSWTEENALRLWDSADFTSTASYSLDGTITNLNYSRDGRFILATTGKPAEIVTWRFNNCRNMEPVTNTDYEETLKSQPSNDYLDLLPEDEQMVTEPDDPDKDEVECDSSDDGDDDFL